MNFIKALIDKRVDLEFLESSDNENFIFSRPFEDNLQNTVLLQTKDRDFIHKYIFENGERFLITDIILEDGTNYRDTKFKIIIVEEGELPKNTINTLLLKNPSLKKEIFETVRETEEPVLESSTDFLPSDTSLIESSIALEQNYEEEKSVLSIVKERDPNLIKALFDNRVELEFIKSTDTKNYIFSKPFEDNFQNTVLIQTKDRDFIHKYIFENGERFIISDIILEDGSCYRDVKFKLIVNEGEVSRCILNLNLLNKSSETIVPIENKNIFEEEDILAIETPLEEAKEEKITETDIPDYTTLVDTLNRLEKEKKVYEENKVVSNRLKNQKKEIVSEILYTLFYHKNFDKTRESARKLVDESLKNESKALKYFFAEYIKKEAGQFKELINEIYDEYKSKFPDIENDISRVSSSLEKLVKEQKNLLDKKDKFINELKAHINSSITQYSRRILELGAGGGTNAVQYYNGGTMYGDLIIEGNIHAVNFDSLFTTVQTYSATWSSGGGGSGTSSASANWNSTYNTVYGLSANWQYAYEQIDKTTTIINYLSSQIDLNVFKNVNSNYDTIYEFTSNPHSLVYSGYTVTLKNKRVYILAGQDQNNPNHYIELNANPNKPIYVEASLSASGTIIDVIDLNDFRSAKYTIQVQNNYNNDIYYSELNVVGVPGLNQSVVSEYGQLFTLQLLDRYDSYISSNFMYLSASFMDPIGDPDKKYIFKGLRTNFYKI